MSETNFSWGSSTSCIYLWAILQVLTTPPHLPQAFWLYTYRILSIFFFGIGLSGNSPEVLKKKIKRLLQSHVFFLHNKCTSVYEFCNCLRKYNWKPLYSGVHMIKPDSENVENHRQFVNLKWEGTELAIFGTNLHPQEVWSKSSLFVLQSPLGELSDHKINPLFLKKNTSA